MTHIQEHYISRKAALLRAKVLSKDNDYIAVIQSNDGYWIENETPIIRTFEKVIKTYEKPAVLPPASS